MSPCVSDKQSIEQITISDYSNTVSVSDRFTDEGRLERVAACDACGNEKYNIEPEVLGLRARSIWDAYPAQHRPSFPNFYEELKKQMRLRREHGECWWCLLDEMQRGVDRYAKSTDVISGYGKNMIGWIRDGLWACQF